MPHEQGSPTAVRLLIAESSEHSAQRFDSILRDAGIPTRIQLVDLPMAGEALPAADLMLCNAALPQLEQLLPQLRIQAPEVPIILVNHHDAAMPTTRGLRLGAADVISGDDPEQLVLVFRRELEHVTRTRQVGELHHALQEAEQRCELLLQTAETPIAYVHEGMHIHANAPYLALFGIADVDDVLGMPIMDLLTDESADALRAELKRFRQGSSEQELAFAAHTRDGSLIGGRMTLAAARYEGEACLQITLYPDHAAEPSSGDPAPGLGYAPNCPQDGSDNEAATNGGAAARGTPFASVGDFLADAARLFASTAPCMAVLVVHVDQFARLQAQHGARGGEIISARLHEALLSQLSGYPVVRLAQHQFAVAMRQRDRTYLRSLCENVLKHLAGLQIDLSHGKVSVEAYVGAGLLETEGTAPSPERIESALDLALGAVARLVESGENRYELTGGNLDAESPETESGRILARVNRAIEENQFRLLYQPIVSLRGDASEHYEVFLRMVDGDGPDLRPDRFLGTAIEHGVAGKIDRWVILRAIKALIAHRANGHDTRLTINVTANSITDPDFGTWLGVALRAARLPSDAIIFQLAEIDIVDKARQAQAFVQSLRALHCQSSLARFGLQADSLERLRHLPVDYVKLDGSLVEAMQNDANARQNVTQTLSRLQQLGKLSVVPMVETASILSVLWQGGANFVQGDYMQPAGPEMNFDFNPAE